MTGTVPVNKELLTRTVPVNNSVLFIFLPSNFDRAFFLVKVGVAVYGRYSSTVPPVSYMAHIWGSLVVITIGLVVLKTFQQKLWERWVWWTALFIYSAFIIMAFAANLIA